MTCVGMRRYASTGENTPAAERSQGSLVSRASCSAEAMLIYMASEILMYKACHLQSHALYIRSFAWVPRSAVLSMTEPLPE